MKLLVLYSSDEDIELSMAAIGTLAQLSIENKQICEKILNVKSFVQIFKECACAESIQIQFGTFYILNNITLINQDLCNKVVNSELMEVIVALSRIQVEKSRIKVYLKSY